MSCDITPTLTNIDCGPDNRKVVQPKKESYIIKVKNKAGKTVEIPVIDVKHNEEHREVAMQALKAVNRNRGSKYLLASWAQGGGCYQNPTYRD